MLCPKEDKAGRPVQPEIRCMGSIGLKQAFDIRSNTWFGGYLSELRAGMVEHALKNEYRRMFYRNGGKVSPWGIDAAKGIAENVPL